MKGRQVKGEEKVEVGRAMGKKEGKRERIMETKERRMKERGGEGK